MPPPALPPPQLIMMPPPAMPPHTATQAYYMSLMQQQQQNPFNTFSDISNLYNSTTCAVTHNPTSMLHNNNNSSYQSHLNLPGAQFDNSHSYTNKVSNK